MAAERLAKRMKFNEHTIISLVEIKQIELHLKEYQILVVSDTDNFDFIYVGERKDKQIVLFFHDSHFDYIKSLPAFFDCDKFCFICLLPFHHDLSHECIKICKFCHQKGCGQEKNTEFICSKCKVFCSDKTCLLNHQEKVCVKFIKCDTCGRIRTKLHMCNGRWCLNCALAVPMDHKCFILTQSERESRKKRGNKRNSDGKQIELECEKKGYIFFDYESMNVDGVHIPNLIIADKICFQCIDVWDLYVSRNINCQNECGIQHFNNNDDFCYWLLKQKNYIGFAHNLKAYDGIFIMKYIVDNPLPTDKSPQIILNGLKLMSIEFEKIKLIDSHNFIPMPLSKIPATFGYTEMHKGFFPHEFNIPENQNKIFDSYPSIDFYGHKFMQVKEREEFLRWHAAQAGKKFNFQQDLYNYCLSDVEILKNGCLLYRKLFLEITKKDGVGIDPFLNCVTLPAACHLLYRQNFMIPKSIALIPDYGFDPTQNYSHKQMLWLKYISFEMKFKLNVVLMA